MTLTLRDLAFVGGGAPAVPWTPAQLGATLRVWLDADDASTITLNGSTVSQWRDKSGGARHFSQSVSAEQPTYETSAINARAAVRFRTLTGTGSELKHVRYTSGLVFGGTGATIAAFFNTFANTNNDGVADIVTSAAPVGRIGFGLRFGFVPSRVNFLPAALYGNGSFPYVGPTMNSPTTANTPGSMIATIDASGSTLTHFNGASGSVIAQAWSNFTSTQMRIGGGGFFTYPGQIGEVLIMVDPIGASDRQKLEGYLAHKWQGAGASNSLPSGHPFKSAAPTV